MAACITRSFTVHKTFFTRYSTSYVKCFSSLSSIHVKASSSYWNSYQCNRKKLKDPQQVQCRYYFLDALEPFNDLLFGGSDKSQAFKLLIVQAHDFTGLPWWATIISASLAVKILIGLPCGVAQQHLTAKLATTHTELEAAAEELKHKILINARKERWTQKKASLEFRKEMRNHWKALVLKNNCHPFKNVILFVLQFPFWLMLTLSIRNFAMSVASLNFENPVPELQFLVGGPFWCQNLAAPDPTFILPTINALAILTNIEINFLQAQLKKKKKENFFLKKIVPNVMRLIAVAFFFISASSPSGMSLFWACSSLIALLQNLLFMSPRVRKFLRIPPHPSDLSKPFSQVSSAFLVKVHSLFFRK